VGKDVLNFRLEVLMHDGTLLKFTMTDAVSGKGTDQSDSTKTM